jgi:hypothetical protein
MQFGVLIDFAMNVDDETSFFQCLQMRLDRRVIFHGCPVDNREGRRRAWRSLRRLKQNPRPSQTVISHANHERISSERAQKPSRARERSQVQWRGKPAMNELHAGHEQISFDGPLELRQPCVFAIDDGQRTRRVARSVTRVF